MTKRWYVVRIKPNCDRMAASALSRDGFDLFFPQVDISIRKIQSKRVPMFPGYLFLRCNILGHDLPIISRLPGVFGWLRVDGETPHVPDDVMQELRARIESFRSTGGLWERFKAGQLVRVAQGKLEALATVLVEPSSRNNRVRVLLEFMGREVRATVPWQSLEPMSEDQSERALRRQGRRTRGQRRWIRGFGPRAAAQT